VQGGYSVKNAREVAFVAADYDKALPLTIDPALVYSTVLQELMQSTIFAGQYPTGQNFEFDSSYGIATDSAGAAYITGEAALPDPSQALQSQPSLCSLVEHSSSNSIRLAPTSNTAPISAAKVRAALSRVGGAPSLLTIWEMHISQATLSLPTFRLPQEPTAQRQFVPEGMATP
jgi:hypothetical protein